MNGKTGSPASLFQVVLIAALLLLFGATTYTLVTVGGDSYRRVMAARDENANARIALSYISMRVRQNDAENALFVDPDNQALRLRVFAGDEVYENRIYYYNGGLYECLVLADMPFDPLLGWRVADIAGLDLSAEEGEGGVLLRVTVYPTQEAEGLSTALSMRSVQEGGL